MYSLNAEQKTIGELFKKPNVQFLVPDYQRNYSWTIDHCRTLWNDIYSFAFPNGNSESFDEKEKYFLGTIITFHNEDGKDEIIDGQQRLITFLLLLRAFYTASEDMKDTNEDARELISEIEHCIWNKEPRRPLDKDKVKVESEVASDDNKRKFKGIMKNGVIGDNDKSKYSENYSWFQKQIDKLKIKTPNLFLDMPWRILRNCIILPITADSQDTALRIFTTLNDRGMPLSDSDIFKAKFYKFFSTSEVARKNFSQRWKSLEETCKKIFHPRRGSALDDLFTRYMYYVVASRKITNTTFKGLRKFYEQKDYELLRKENTFEELILLANFWKSVYERDEEHFSERVIRLLYILEYSPYVMWYYAVSVYFLVKRNKYNQLEDAPFYKFLSKITAFILAHSIDKPGVDAIRLPMLYEMVNLVNNQPIDFKNYKFRESLFKIKREEFSFSNSKLITRSMLAWWAFKDDSQDLPPIDTVLEIEHIYAKNRKNSLMDESSIELLGNKALLEKRINIRASDCRFEDKRKYYLGYTKGQQNGTMIRELRDIAQTKEDFTEEDILARNEKIFSAFIEYLGQNNLLR